ncbi:NAD(P)-dependent dehydrogenase (short-subunit alcohol dehydrogenase family) [Litorivivens lipolytica]|uniref:NAD(P)-dependent dehydrogenase (Short-subunit alcohol dehydrogenase family) n=1 Tax=Litorivivens lipolytica TaxID=1524264 RepID=A0A7W4Z582_9GAMM|nr:NAD(P)-dependent dehydrogenase (short-subunit alcohol dehydrogenase family) [Litorivivens lipolytica]
MKPSAPVVAISGAASGIGRALAHHYASRGARLSLSDVSTLEVVAGECRLRGAADVLCATVDVSNRHQVQAWAERSQRHFGVINIVINNAGVNLSGCFEQMEREDFHWQMDINFWGVVNGCEAFLPWLKQAPWGHVVNVSSLFGLIAMPNQSAYNASKFAVKGFTESLALEMAQSSYNIQVSTVHPGGIQTNIVNSARFGCPQKGVLDIDEAKQTFNTKLARTTAAEAAAIIVKGIEQRKRRILVGRDARALDVVQRLLPALYQRLVLRYVP